MRKNTYNKINILCIPISVLTKVDENLNEQFLEDLLNNIPNFGKKHDNYYLVNNNLTINSSHNNRFLQLFNVFLHKSTMKYNLIQFLKNKQKTNE